MKRVLVLLALSLCLAQIPLSEAAPPGTDIDPAIIKLMEVTGMPKMKEQMLADMGANFEAMLKAAFPGIPQRSLTILREEFMNQADKDSGSFFMPTMAETCAKYYTHDEIMQLTAFYQTPLGKKTLQVMPAMMAEMSKKGMAWGQQVAGRAMPRAMERLRAEGLIK